MLGFLKLLSSTTLVCVCGCVFACVFVHAHVPAQRILTTSGMIWTPYDLLKKFYGLYVVALVGIISRCYLSIDTHYGNQFNKRKLAVCKLSIHFGSSLE